MQPDVISAEIAPAAAQRHAALSFAPAGAVQLGGLLGTALAANHRGRLSTFITGRTSPAVALFDPARAAGNLAGDWYGEHVGKWLCAAARAAVRTSDAALRERVQDVADYLVSVQDADGYLGTYALERRFTRRQPPKPPSWDGAPALRTWDVWVHAYVILGLLETYRLFGAPEHLSAARRIGDLCWHTLTAGGIDVTELGNHHGLSATVLVDAAVELHAVSGAGRYLDLARLVVEQADRHAPLALLRKLLAGADVAEIGTGKAYQLIWNLVGLAKLHRASGEERYLQAALNGWQSIRAHHLTLDGGPWGGVAHRSREVFNAAGVFDPRGYVETCSTLAWIQLNRELLATTGEARYAAQIERSAYNALIGAQAPNGEDWCYYSFPNGRRVHTTHWRCCKSSGALGLEELPSIAYAVDRDGGIRVNLLCESQAQLELPGAGSVRIEQRGRYPFDGHVTLRVAPQRAATFRILVRIPEWADGATLRVDGTAGVEPVAGEWAVLERHWREGDTVQLTLPLRARVQRRTQRNLQIAQAPDGTPVEQEVLRFDYLALSRGPLVYATPLIDGYKVEETLRFDAGPEEHWISALPAPDGAPEGDDLRLQPLGRPALEFSPFYRAGGRRDGAWRLTWMSLAPE